MPTPQDIIIEQLESEIESMKLQQTKGNEECMALVRNLMGYSRIEDIINMEEEEEE